MALVNLGLTLFDRGDLAGSRAAVDEALTIRRQQHDKNNTAQAVAALALVSLAEDRLPEANTLIAESTSLRRELGEQIALAQSQSIHSEILLEQNNAAAAERAAREAAASFHRASAWGWEGEAALAVARAQLARGDAERAAVSLDSASAILRDSKDMRLLLRRDITLARIRQALGRQDEAAAILDRAMADAQRAGFAGIAFEIRLALAQTGRLPADSGRRGGSQWRVSADCAKGAVDAGLAGMRYLPHTAVRSGVAAVKSGTPRNSRAALP